jgi:diadenylate cyclase
MIPSLDTLFADALFRISNISWLQIIDIVLVTLAFFFLLDLIRRSQAAFLLRGAVVLILVLFFFTVVLPLPTFDWLIRGALIAILVATPVIFQPELRRLLESLGRTFRMTTFQKRVQESTLLPIVRAVENMANNYIGALIVLEGNDDLGRIVETGVPIRGKVSSELLQTIFFEGTPLHDGGAVVRQDDVISAGCVLPVSNRQLYGGNRRLGMRHRAALGLSEVSDALAVVVSEETGRISIARSNQMDLDLDIGTLRERIVDFYQPASQAATGLPAKELFGMLRDRIKSLLAPSFSRKRLTNLGLWLVAALLALTAWAFVIQETNPARQTLVEDIPLVVQNVPTGSRILTEMPKTVSAIVKTTDALLPSLSANAFQATISLGGKEPGLYRLNVNVSSGVSPVQIVSVEPALLDVELAQIISRTMDVTIELNGEETLSAAYQVQDAPIITPTQVTVTGAEATIDQIRTLQAEAVISDNNSLEATRVRVIPVGEDGQIVEGVTLQPEEVQVHVPIGRRTNSRLVGVRVETEGAVPSGYRINRIRTFPSRLIILAAAEQLDTLNNFISTIPIDLSQVVGDLSVEIPLATPPGVEVMTEDGQAVVAIRVELEVVPRIGTLTVVRQIEILNQVDSTLSLDLSTVDLVLSGPIPILDEITANPDLVRVFIDVSKLENLSPGQTLTVTPRVVVPDEVTAQLVPNIIQITLVG